MRILRGGEMSKSDTHSIISVLWLIASGLQPDGSGFVTGCLLFFVCYSLSALWYTYKKDKP